MHPIPVSVLDLAIILEGKTASDSFHNSLNLARHAEEIGYTRFWLAEHHNMASVASSATSVLIGHIAGGTRSIRVGSGGIMLPNHPPLIVAEQFGTLASLYPGRIDLGLGRAPGTDQVTIRALRRDRDAGMQFPEDVLELMRYFSADNSNAPVRAIPGEGLDIPIWILGSSTDSAYLAAAMGLPYAFASHFAPAQLHQAISIYRNRFRPSARLDKPYIMPCINITAAGTDEEAEWLASSSKNLFKGIITGARKPLQPPVTELHLSPQEEAALQQMTTYAFTGGPEKIRRQMTLFMEETRADELMIVSHIYSQDARLSSYSIIKDIMDSI